MKTKPGIVILVIFLVFVTLFILWMRQLDWKNPIEIANESGFVEIGGKVESSESAKNFQNVMIVDGDTIDINGQRIRYIGINTPELGHSKGVDDCFGKEAMDFNRNLVISGELRLEKDVSETDKYGRLLRYVYLSDGRMVNEEMVREGYARAATYPPDVKYAEKFRLLEREAKYSSKGLWGKCF